MKPVKFSFALWASVALLGACTQFPALDHTISPELANADYPELVPLQPVLAAAQNSRVEPVQAGAAIDGRVAALKARAARLRGSVLTGAERQRLAKGLR
ncbi:hypothetical protein [Sulfitobacter donghicola]|uniref:Lipoprotein n=1 Tax=Sulfitobacter donghicola DSW-25 = KCTC 12864 = JCM 14565 TaxID=1300350 RepID=A0A073IHK7_9RHOB|nr:hypothetical protein [Sulfitobacter donghicola]KEJ89269.1 hypothetical protein DSW25_09585 [Sulfitobacter donghicola DSW-25 = KCTC 12864 = JCM 14565]KIN69066.1 hypothetical protein Z948_2801 [Sulfitobacter donghicola DSW-25 = KCTC 12864 = JCM 14565]